jgi:hypothetical protein
MGVSFPVARKSWVSFPDDFQLLPSQSLVLARFSLTKKKAVLNRVRRFWGEYESEEPPGLIIPFLLAGNCLLGLFFSDGINATHSRRGKNERGETEHTNPWQFLMAGARFDPTAFGSASRSQDLPSRVQTNSLLFLKLSPNGELRIPDFIDLGGWKESEKGVLGWK